MDEEQIKRLLKAVLGADGLDVARNLQGNSRARELSIIKVDTFSGKEGEDPMNG